MSEEIDLAAVAEEMLEGLKQLSPADEPLRMIEVEPEIDDPFVNRLKKNQGDLNAYH